MGIHGMLLGGGWAVRLFSLSVLLRAVEALNARGAPALFNLHPWELDPDPPRLPLPPLARFVHYAGLGGFRERVHEMFRLLPLGPIPE
ncbi:MAG: hypothetical protein DMH00_12185 [Acidobacteria bacterium]|nr:MAG: hypothetical protein DMH00_12185 [Acidobacteriota bacterium]